MSWIKIQIEWIKSFWTAPDGKGSSKRLHATLIILTFMITYLRISILKSEITDIPPTWAVVVAAVLGLQIWGNKQENKTE